MIDVSKTLWSRGTVRAVLGWLALGALGIEGAAQLPPLVAPPENPITLDKVNLGHVLFWDEQLSSTRTVACGTCHIPEAGGGDPRSGGQVHPGPDGVFGTADDAFGSPGVPLSAADGRYLETFHFGFGVQVTARVAPSAINAAFNNEQFWDGRADGVFTDPLTGAVLIPARGSLENQAASPPLADSEMAHQGRTWQEVADRIAASKPLALATDIPAGIASWMSTRSYPDLFALAFGTPDVTPGRIIMAIATYERTLVSDQTPMDRFNMGDPTALTPQEAQGFDLFNGVAACTTCHAGALLRNQGYANIGWRPAAEDVGRFAVTNDPGDLGAFRVPGLRNVGLRSRYFHNGGAGSLEEVVDLYDRGGDFPENLDPVMRPLGLSQADKDALVAFLRNGLTDPRVAAGLPPFARPTLYSERNQAPTSYGAPGRGTGGYPPILVGLEPPVLGNPSFTLTLAQGLGGRWAALVFDVARGSGAFTPLGVPLHVAGSRPVLVPLGALSGPADVAGAGSWSGSFAISTYPSMVGQSVFVQGFVADHAQRYGFASTAGLEITFFAPR